MENMDRSTIGRIAELYGVFLEDILLEMILNIDNGNNKSSYRLGISDDGETILCDKRSKWFEAGEMEYEAYSTIKINTNDSNLGRLLDNEVLNIRFGIGKTPDTGLSVIYYIKIDTNCNTFLFFNNGDEGAYSFDEIEKILAHDIYGFEWSDKLPVVNL